MTGKFELSGEICTKQFSFGSARADRTSIIRHLIATYQLRSYLEIGVRDFRNYDKVDCLEKTAVDPAPFGMDQRGISENVFQLTSDAFFAQLDPHFQYDLIFIDGLHLAEQVEKDIANSLQHLSDRGFIVMHDCNPPTEFHQREVYKVDGKFPSWNGTTWKAYAKRRMTDTNINMSVVNVDWGVGVIYKGHQQPFPQRQIIDWALLDSERARLLNLISVDQFLASH